MTEEQKVLIQRLNLKSGIYKVKKENNKFKLVQIKDDTLGCILCGEKVVNGYLYNSTPYELELTSILKQEVTRGNTIYLDIIKYEEESRQL